MRDRVWIAVSSTGTITAWDTQAAATNHLRDDAGDIWIEEVDVNTPSAAAGADLSDETRSGDHPDAPTPIPQAGAQRRRTWIGPATYTHLGGDAA